MSHHAPILNLNDHEHFKIMIVDDEPFNVEIMRETLLDAGFPHIISSSDPRDAIQLCQDGQPDLLLLDLQMPHMHGFEVLQALQQLEASRFLPVMILTADTSRTTRIRGLQLGAVDFLCKPFDKDDIIARIHNHISIRRNYRTLNNENRSLDLMVQASTQRLKEKQDHLHRLNAELETRIHDRTLALNAANKNLIAANQTMSEMISIVSHEFRTPLTSIKGFAEILRNDFASIDTDTRNQFLDIINNESDRLSRLVSDLLDMQKIAAGKMGWNYQDFNLLEILKQVQQIVMPSFIGKGIGLELHSDLRSSQFHGDRDRIQQVVINLLSNAVKFTEQGKVEIRVSLDKHWAVIAILSCNRQLLASYQRAAANLGIHSLIFCDPTELRAYLVKQGGRLSLLVLDTRKRQHEELELLDQIRSETPHIAVISLKNEDAGDPDAPVTVSDTVENHLIGWFQDFFGLTPTQYMYCIEVSDSGIGIPDEELNKVFRRFHQVNQSETRQQRGTGLGLTICKEIVEHHLGRLWVNSIPGHGSTFTILLPATTAAGTKLSPVSGENPLETTSQHPHTLENHPLWPIRFVF